MDQEVRLTPFGVELITNQFDDVENVWSLIALSGGLDLDVV